MRLLARVSQTGKKTPGGAGTHIRDTHGTHGRTDHTDEPHNHPNPTTLPHDLATAETAAETAYRYMPVQKRLKGHVSS